ncbi:MAG: hypothetical protein HGB11_10860 [Chlorobiales bacterium]|nr:hypothetical protein [Chlorobiales bacterium]
MDKSTLKSALKLSKKAVAELKVAAKMVPDRRRQRDIEIKVMAAEKLLRRVQEQITGDRAEETQKEIKDTKQSRFQGIKTDKSIFERTQEAFLKLKPDNSEVTQRAAPRISGEPPTSSSRSAMANRTTNSSRGSGSTTERPKSSNAPMSPSTWRRSRRGTDFP